MDGNSKPIYLFGASGHAKVVIDILQNNSMIVKGIFDDDPEKKNLRNIPVLGVTEKHSDLTNPCIITIGNNKIRKAVRQRLNAKYVSAISKQSCISQSVTIDVGTVIMPSATINADTIIKKHTIINTSVSVDHDCIIHDFVHIAPNATLCGGVEIGEGTIIGAGATIIPLIKIGKWCTIGAGSVIVADVPDYATVVGNPGRIIKVDQI